MCRGEVCPPLVRAEPSRGNPLRFQDHRQGDLRAWPPAAGWAAPSELPRLSKVLFAVGMFIKGERWVSVHPLVLWGSVPSVVSLLL